jgi:hypothetical protein
LNLDKLISSNNLFERLDKLYPDIASKDKNDAIMYWKGKKIVSLAEWKEIVNYNEAFQHGIEHQNTREALQYFPGDFQRFPLFPLGVEDELREAANIWWKQYIELMKFTKNLTYLAKIARARGERAEGEQDELDYEWDYDEGEEQEEEEEEEQENGEQTAN